MQGQLTVAHISYVQDYVREYKHLVWTEIMTMPLNCAQNIILSLNITRYFVMLKTEVMCDW